MATTTKTTKILRHHFALNNGGSRYIDIDNPIDDAAQIKTNIENLNSHIEDDYYGILVGTDYFDGDSNAIVTSCTSAEIIETTKTVTTTDISL